LPFILLFTVVGLGSFVRFKRTAYFLIAISALYMLIFTSLQFKGKEMDGLHASLTELKKYVGKDDILLLDKRRLHTAGEIKTSLKFYYDYNVLSVKDTDKEKFINYFCSKHKDVYLFNTNAINEHTNAIKDINSIDVEVELFKYSNHIPTNIVKISKQYYLSKVSCVEYLNEKIRKDYMLFDQRVALGRVDGFHDDKVWTKGALSLTNIDIGVDDNQFLVLETFGHNPMGNNIEKLNLMVKINGNATEFVKHNGNRYFFSLADIKIIKDINILSNTFIPKDLGINRDTRELGMDIKSIKLVRGVN